MPYKKNSNAYKQAGDGEDGAASSGHEDNPIMQMATPKNIGMFSILLLLL
jgi:hypothetical protein